MTEGHDSLTVGEPDLNRNGDTYRLACFVNLGLPVTDYRLGLQSADWTESVRYFTPEETGDDWRRLRTGAGVTPVDAAGLIDLVRAMWWCRRTSHIAMFFSSKLNTVGPPLAHVFGVRSVCTLTGFGRQYDSAKLGGRIYRYALAHSIKLADLVLLQKRSDRARVTSLCPSAAVKTHFVGSGTSVASIESHHEEARTSRIVFMAGRLIRSKGILDFIHLARSYPKEGAVRFVLAGPSDTHEPEISTAVRAAQEDGAVEYLGPIPHEEVLVWLRAARVLLFTSHAEGMSRVVLEAVACGCPVVGWAIEANRDALLDGREAVEFLAELGDRAAMIRVLQQVLSDDGCWLETLRDQRDATREYTVAAYLDRVRTALSTMS